MIDFDGATKLTLRQQILLRHQDLIDARAPRMQDYRDLSDYILPRRSRFLHSDKRQRTRNTKMINSAAARAVRVLESGMMAGMTNPSRPWMRVVAEKHLMRISRVARWCDLATEKVLRTFLRCNIYKALPKLYGVTGVFGTGVLHVEPDPRDVIRAYVLPTGQYVIDNDARGRVDTLHREFEMTARNLVAKFGVGKVSERVRSAYRAKRFNEPVVVIHAVAPRKDRDPDKLDSVNMPWGSHWLEKDGKDSDGFLRTSGYRRFPFFAFRWDVTDDQNDAYGDGPGIEALGDAIALQHLMKRKAQAVDKIVSPPMTGPSSVKASNLSLVPNGFTPVDAVQGGQQFKASVEINYQAPTALGQEALEHEKRIKESFYNDIWLMMAGSDRREITAREVDERHEEKMIQLGPVVDRGDDELIDPLVEFTIAELIQRGPENDGLPPPPPDLEGSVLQVDNISILAQAQKLVGTVGLERLMGFVGNFAAVDKRVLDNVDRDRVVRNYTDMLGVDPSNLTDEETMASERQAQAEAAQAEQAAAEAPALKSGADAAKVLSETDVQGDNALSRLLGSIGAEDL